MRVLLIKTSSMGDLIHTLPALVDAHQAIPDIQFDWIVEDLFSAIPHWNAQVANVIPVALRRWRKGLFSKETRGEWRDLRQRLNHQHYDVVLDAQGLVKSAFLAFFTHGERVGLDWHSAREALASLTYQRKCTVNFYQHAITRMRSLFSQALGYPLPTTAANFGIHREQFQQNRAQQEKYLVFLHGTTWVTKQWPEKYWGELAHLAEQAGYGVKISGGNVDEIKRAERIAAMAQKVHVMPPLDISSMATLLANATAAVSVDTGFGHLAAALNLPVVSLYGATNPDYTGAIGQFSTHLKADFPCAPCLNRYCLYKKSSAVHPACYTKLTPLSVWKSVEKLLGAKRGS